jgi:glycosyltransferase involved in cell wall biosynthesis
MKIFYDHMVFARQKYGGISKYFCELLKRIPQENWYLSVLISNNLYLKEIGVNTIPFFPQLDFRGKERIQEELGFPLSIYKLHSASWDVFHSTSLMKFHCLMPKNRPTVVTAHDVLYYLFHQENPKRNKLSNIDRNACQEATKIIAISENTKKDYIRYYGADENKITVIHHGVDKEKKKISGKRIEEHPYILYVGLRYDYKNFYRFIKAFAVVSEKHADLRLLCTGSPFSAEEMKIFTSLNISDKVRFIFASEQEMAQLYHDAEMFVYPSLYEGFGMPILEAMVYDCPVVLSNASCFPEIAQNAGLYFNPYEVDDMADKIQSLLHDASLRKTMVMRGRERLACFSWDKCAEEHMNVYKSLL